MTTVAFDLLGTIYPVAPLRDAIAAFGLPLGSLEGWIAAAQRDTLGLAAVGEVRPFFEVMDAALDSLLADHNLYEPAGARAALLDRLANLEPHPEARETLALLASEGIVAVALSKRPAADAAPIIGAAGLGSNVVSLHDVRSARPQGEIFHELAQAIGGDIRKVGMVTAFPWVVNGGAAVGFRTAWLSDSRLYPRTMRAPDVEAPTLLGVVRGLLGIDGRRRVTATA